MMRPHHFFSVQMHLATLISTLLAHRASPLQPQPSPTAQRVSEEILEGLQKTSRLKTQTGSLDLETDFYDSSTGLYSEGVWHNCMAGIASLSRVDTDEKVAAETAKSANSLFQHSWDGISFKRRSWSGNWDHSRLLQEDTDVVQANYYKECGEHRCVQHGLACVFWSKLVCNSDDSTNSDGIKQQQALIAKQFVNEFWNGQRWTTVSKSQGGDSTLRPSASSGKNNLPSSNEEESKYFRAVDQAIAVLANLQHLQVVDDIGEKDKLVGIIQSTCKDLLERFGYNHLPTAQTYLGLRRNRNFWHEGWVMLALSCARDYAWPMDAQEGQLMALWEGLMERYQDPKDHTIWHWALEDKDATNNMRYCGDNALGFAIRRCAAGGSDTIMTGDDDNAFWRFVDMLRSRNRDQYDLASVADVYPQARLHPNTELAALLVWPNDEYRL